MNLVTAALNGGEDYELLFTVPLTEHEKVSKIPGVKVIGYIGKFLQFSWRYSQRLRYRVCITEETGGMRDYDQGGGSI